MHLNTTYQSLLQTYINSPSTERPPEALIQLLSSPRVRLLDLSHLDEVHGTTLLHEAARRKDLRLVEMAISAGADVFTRDRKGRMAGDGHSKDDRVKVFLRQCECSSLAYVILLILLQSRTKTRLF
jgi:oxysterol-binding protein 1